MSRVRGLVSVVIPCYNHGDYILDTVQSVLDQTYKNYEVFIVDDGSDDLQTRKVLWELDHPQIKVLRKVNGHVSSARNHGIRFSTGEFILSLDSDDQFTPDFLEKAVPILNQDLDTGAVTCYANVFDHKGHITSHHKTGGGTSDFLAENNSMASALFRYQCWEETGGYNESYNATTKGFEDWDFWLMVTRAGWKIHSIPEYLIHYRKAPHSMSQQYENEVPAMMKQLVLKHEDVYRENVAEIIYQKELLIAQLKNNAEACKNSLTYRLGHTLLYPLKPIWSMLKTKKPITGNSLYTNQPKLEITCNEKEDLSVS
ncbi:MAG: glycosyltransferase family A protein [Balneolales bacterium]